MLRISNLRFSLGQTAILNGVDLAVSAGERVGIIGPNGSGKTTLFNCLSGFNTPNSGSVIFKDVELTKLDPHERAVLGLGRVFQNPGIFKEMTVVENIITALESKQQGICFPWSSRTKRNKERSYEYLKMVRLDERGEAKAGSLSGGQLRLLEIARSIATDAELFLLDEPTAGVSPKMKGEVEALLSELQKMKKTILIIEHDLSFVQKLCDRIVVLDQGKVVLEDLPENVRSNAMLQEIYFGAS